MVAMTERRKKRSGKTAIQKRLLDLRERLGKSNDEMANLIGVPYRTWISWIYGESNPSRTAILLIDRIEADLKKNK